jgi:hypothetical protein
MDNNKISPPVLSNTSLLLTRVAAVLDLLENTEHFPTSIYNKLYEIYKDIHYTAPELIGRCNERIGYTCLKHVDTLEKFNVDTKIQNIMQGK